MKRGAALEAVFKPVRPPTTFEETVERLGTAIRVGLLAPGSRAAARAPARRGAADLALDPAPGAHHPGPVGAPDLDSAAAPAAPSSPSARRSRRSTSEPLGRDAWAMLDHRVAIEVGSVILAAERAQDRRPRRARRAGRADGGGGEFELYRRADIRFHIGVAEAARSPRLVTEMTEVQGADERPDRPHRPPRGGPDPLQRPARGARRACCASGDAAGAVALIRTHIRGTEHILAGLL